MTEAGEAAESNKRKRQKRWHTETEMRNSEIVESNDESVEESRSGHRYIDRQAAGITLNSGFGHSMSRIRLIS